MKIYTGAGDGGETGLYGGTRIGKDALRVEAYGSVDELNASIGWAITQVADPDICDLLLSIQNDLFVAGSDLATPQARDVPRIVPAHSARLEHEIDSYEETLEPLRQFILPGGCPGAAALHLARCVCRRVERRLVALMRQEAITPEVEVYLNRLSDLLFVLARAANARAGFADIAWTKTSSS